MSMTDSELTRLTRMRDRARTDGTGTAHLLTQVLYDLRTLRKGENLALEAAHAAMPGESFSCSQEAIVAIAGARDTIKKNVDQMLAAHQRAADIANSNADLVGERTRERDAARAAYACVCEAVTPGSVGGADATAIMAEITRNEREDARIRVAELEAERDALGATCKALRNGEEAPHYCAYCMERIKSGGDVDHMLACEKAPFVVLTEQLAEAHGMAEELQERVAAKEEDRLLARQKLDCARTNNNTLRARIAEMESEKKPWR